MVFVVAAPFGQMGSCVILRLRPCGGRVAKWRRVGRHAVGLNVRTNG